MEPPRDFCELLALFNDRRVSAIIVGAYALAFHGVPRTTGDLDLLLRRDRENAARVMLALGDFGFGAVGLTPADFEKPDVVVQLGVAPVRLDLMTSITGVSWEQAFSGSVPGDFGGVAVRYLGLEELRRNKRAVGRHKDLADLEALGDDSEKH
jgi:hypothetical protein